MIGALSLGPFAQQLCVTVPAIRYMQTHRRPSRGQIGRNSRQQDSNAQLWHSMGHHSRYLDPKCIAVPANCPSGNCTFMNLTGQSDTAVVVRHIIVVEYHHRISPKAPQQTTFEVPNGWSASRQGSEDDRNFIM